MLLTVTVQQKMAVIHVLKGTLVTMDNASNALNPVESMGPVLNAAVKQKEHRSHVLTAL